METNRKSSKKVIPGLIIILSLGIFTSLSTNLLRKDGIPVLPEYMWSEASGQIKRADFENGQTASLGGVLVDARPNDLYRKCHGERALNLPLENFDFFYGLRFSNVSIDKPVFIYGRSLSRAYDQQAAHRLLEKGHSNITIVRLKLPCSQGTWQ
jgi:rhodanese-related sulfurtransferase